MGVISNIRNFFYAATHANLLISENERLAADNLELILLLHRYPPRNLNLNEVNTNAH